MALALSRLVEKFRPVFHGSEASERMLPPDMQSVLDHLVERIIEAPIDPLPDDNIFIEEVFPPAVYAKILRLLPADGAYNDIEHPDAVLPDGTKTRKLLDLTDKTLARLSAESHAFWAGMKSVLTSGTLQRAIIQKFSRRMNDQYGSRWPRMVTVPLFYRDLPGYRIGIHPDAPFKMATMQFYFPKDDSQIHLGTSFHVKEAGQFRLHKTNKFKPNSAYAFVRTDNSWHSVSQLGPNEGVRDSLALTIYKAGSEYKSGYGTDGKPT